MDNAILCTQIKHSEERGQSSLQAPPKSLRTLVIPQVSQELGVTTWPPRPLCVMVAKGDEHSGEHHCITRMRKQRTQRGDLVRTTRSGGNAGPGEWGSGPHTAGAPHPLLQGPDPMPRGPYPTGLAPRPTKSLGPPPGSAGISVLQDIWAFLVAQGEESTCQGRRPGFHPWPRKMPWRRE